MQTSLAAGAHKEMTMRAPRKFSENNFLQAKWLKTLLPFIYKLCVRLV
jgi:hypothetical protein